MRISIPDDAPPVLASSAAWGGLSSRCELDYHDTLPGSEDGLVQRIGDAEVVLNIRSSSKFSAGVFAACPHLRLVSVWGTGTDHVDLPSAARHGVTITNTPGVSAVSIAEHALALLLAAARQIPHMDESTRRGEWARGQSVELRGKICGIIGLGAIGRQFARLAAAIGMRVIAWTMHPKPLAGVELVELDELYRTSDVVSVHLRLSPETTGFIGAAQFALMKKGAILINTARGAIVDEPSMIDALREHRIRAAGLDVFTVEPLPAGHALTKLQNVVLTPHCAGITPEALEAGLQMAVDNIWAFLEGRPEHVVV
ncbi:MAG TPA: NAD(P)-dependent oxidoreductase [Bryobacteraceae bacterium]|nr:NAD(P)-dependent oxidoreductase [Bryobacteraceae bacterium]